MFITNDELSRRLKTESNLVSKLRREENSLIPDSFPLPAEIDLSPEPEPEKGPILDPEVLGLLENKEEFDPSLLDKLLNPPKVSKLGAKYFHDDERAAIGVTSSILGSRTASHLGDVTSGSARVYSHGYTSPTFQADPARNPKEELRNKVIEGHSLIVDKCFNRLMTTLDLLDEEKLSKVKRASELSTVARNLSGIISSAAAVTQDKYIDNKEQSVHFHIMRPEMALHDEYPTIQIAASESPDLPKSQDPK